MTIARERSVWGMRAKRTARIPLNALDRAGEQMSFYGQTLGWIPKTVTHYGREVTRLLAEVSFGAVGLAIIAGTVGVIFMMALFVGVIVGLAGYASLNQLGASVLTGFLSAYVNTRELAPLIAA